MDRAETRLDRMDEDVGLMGTPPLRGSLPLYPLNYPQYIGARSDVDRARTDPLSSPDQRLTQAADQTELLATASFPDHSLRVVLAGVTLVYSVRS